MSPQANVASVVCSLPELYGDRSRGVPGKIRGTMFDRRPPSGRPPCVMWSRTDAKPICPEGERYCGIPVWRGYDFETLEQRRVM